MIVICFDPNNEIEDFKKRFDQINVKIIFHTDLQLCFDFIQSIGKEKIFLIICSSSPQIFPYVLNYDQINNIFIFSSNDDQFKYSILENPKIIGIYNNNFDVLYSTVEEQISCFNKQFYQWNFFDDIECADKDLSKHSNDVILHLSPKKTSSITNLSRYQMINETLRTKNIDQLYSSRDSLGELIDNLNEQHDKEYFIVYREMKLLNDELNQLIVYLYFFKLNVLVKNEFCSD